MLFFKILEKMMKQTSTEWVCRCTPAQGIVSIDAQMMNTTVTTSVKEILALRGPRRRARRFIALGDMCSRTGHHKTALQVYRFGLKHVMDEEYDQVDMILTARQWHNKNLQWEATILARRMDALLERLHPGMHRHHYAAEVRDTYDDLRHLRAGE